MDLPGFDKQQLKKAVKSLLKYVGEQQESGPPQLLDEDELFHLVLALKKAPVGPRKDKPIRLSIPHPLFSADGAEICLFVKDHKGEGHKAAKARLAKLQKNGGVAKVVGLSKLRTKYESHEAKRQLCNSYDLFLADERIIPSLPKAIGESWCWWCSRLWLAVVGVCMGGGMRVSNSTSSSSSAAAATSWPTVKLGEDRCRRRAGVVSIREGPLLQSCGCSTCHVRFAVSFVECP